MTEISTQTIVSCDDNNDMVFSWSSTSDILIQTFAEVINTMGEELKLSLKDSIHTTISSNILKKVCVLSTVCKDVYSKLSSSPSKAVLMNDSESMVFLEDSPKLCKVFVQGGQDVPSCSKSPCSFDISRMLESDRKESFAEQTEKDEKDIDQIKEEDKCFASSLKSLHDLEPEGNKLLGFNPPSNYRMTHGEVLNALKSLNDTLPSFTRPSFLPLAGLNKPNAQKNISNVIDNSLLPPCVTDIFDKKSTAFESYKKSPVLLGETNTLFSVESPSPLFSLSPLKYDLSSEGFSGLTDRSLLNGHLESGTKNCFMDSSLAKQSGKTFYTCHRCKITFFGESEYEEHIKTHPKGKYNCKFCPMTFKTPTGLTVHENVHTRRQVWLCQLCGKTYSSRASYIQHLQVMHSSGRKYQCPVCGKMSSTSSNLKVHMVIHSNAKPFKCPQCDMTFKRKGCLKSHFIRRHPNKGEGKSSPQLESESRMEIERQVMWLLLYDYCFHVPV
ncbi:zinc finger protein 394-like [Bolinopsis microptera]|uniref:zinc finger protein 394-like n=1 Tax=Bolinopsis microptera TaxID=2820187 RepID=UPI00307A7081